MGKLKRPTFKIVLYTHKTLTSGDHPVMIRVTYDRKQKYYSLGMSATAESWNADLSRYHRPGKRLNDAEKEGNIRISKFAERMTTVAKYFEDVDFTFSRFENRFFQPAQINNVFAFMENVVAKLIEEERIGTAYSYRDTLNRLKEFRKNRDLTFRDVDLNFLDALKRHLRKTNKINSVGLYLRTLKAVYNRAVKAGLIKEELSPFKGYRIEVEATRKRALTKDQIDALKACAFQPGSRRWHSVNYFLFGYYCRGMNFEDIARLTWKNIRNDRIFYVRKKTKDPLDVSIDSRIAEIISRYPAGDHYIFPILAPGLGAATVKNRLKANLKRVNKDLQDVAVEIGLPNDITFYWGRHTAATVLKRSGVSTALISEILGHSTEKVTQSYLDSFDKNQLDEIGKLL